MSYNKLELACIFSNCTTAKEVLKTSDGLSYLIRNWDQGHVHDIPSLAKKRIEYLILNE